MSNFGIECVTKLKIDNVALLYHSSGYILQHTFTNNNISCAPLFKGKDMLLLTHIKCNLDELIFFVIFIFESFLFNMNSGMRLSMNEHFLKLSLI